MTIPAWQTEDLEEEWVESSPSPPAINKVLPPLTHAQINPSTASINAKRGSLRALGHPSRHLPPPRVSSSPSTGSPRIISGHGSGRILSEKMNNASVELAIGGKGGLPSPPTSGDDQGGTFLVKEGVDDDRGRFLAKKGRDMFGPSALEKMFRPPSPVVELSVEPEPSTPTVSHQVLSSTTPLHPPPSADGAHARRASHPYAPTNPSRLSKSVTPSNASSTSISISMPEEVDRTIDWAALGKDTSHFEETLQTEHDNENGPVGSLSQDLNHSTEPHESSPLGSDRDYPFTFSAPRQSTSPLKTLDDPIPTSMSPFDPADGSHSTLHRRNSTSQKKPLRLFRATYDTYTREHLSALVDSIAVDQSPSPSASSGTGQSMGQNDNAEDEDGRSVDSRSSKRMRMSPVSPGRRPAGVRDWAREGQAMLQRIRMATADSTTSASRSTSTITTDVPQSIMSRSAHSPSRSPSYSPPNYPSRQANGQDGPTHRSNPSTASSTYLRRAEEIMAAIRARDISDTPSEDVQEYTSTSRSRTASSRAPSATSSDWGHDFLSDHGSANGQERMTSESEERAGSTNSSGSKPRLEDRRPNSGATQINHRMNITADDVNRLPSATTVATSSMSTSFVKHPGPKHSVPNVGPRMIKPEEVVGIIPDRIGKMRYDRETMRWVKDRTSLDKADVLRENSGSGGRGSRSRSEESEDVFAGIDSWGRSPAPEVGGEDQELEHQDELSSSSEEDEGAIQQADITHIFDEGGSFTETDVSGDDIHPTGQIRPNSKDASPPPRPAPLHANSAPAVMTPRPNSKLSPPKPIRSALRNPMTSVNPSLTPGIKKQIQWHESVTPAPGSSRRSVSFSDGKKNGKIRELHPDESINTIESDLTGRMDGMKLDHVATTFTGDEEFFRGQPDKSWMPSARTKRVQHALGDMENLSLDNGTPSKPSRPAVESLIDSPVDVSYSHRNDEVSSKGDPDRTIMPTSTQFQSIGSRNRSSRRNDGNATFLTECSFGVSHDKLVQVITDVYGSEPYWEHLTQLDLRKKAVESVARLKEFLPELEEVNLNDNKLSYLSGIPSSVAVLHAANNRLSGMTNVSHLSNLTLLDISYNNLDSVSQLSCLVKLEDLRLDGNILKDLTGLEGLSALTKLSAKGNKISKLDMKGVKWSKLQTLDVSSNRITKIEGLSMLTAVREVKLDENRLARIDGNNAMPSLRILKISDNDLTLLDLAMFPKLRLLHADRNRLKSLSRSDESRSRVENLSLRNQANPGLRIDFEELRNVKRLYLSGNPLEAFFSFAGQLPNLTYLEIAACSLSVWPTDLHRKLPNLEIINGNYNYFQNLDGLAEMRSLRRISVVGARLGGDGEKGVAKGLKGMTKLEEVDLRMNPSTLGFYLPLMLPSTQHPVHHDDTPIVPQNPLPSVTLATIRPPDTPAPKHIAQRPDVRKMDNADWARLDGQFRRSLPDEWYSKRLVYRGLIMASLPRLKVLDGVRVEEGERRKAEMLLRAAEVAP